MDFQERFSSNRKCPVGLVASEPYTYIYQKTERKLTDLEFDALLPKAIQSGKIKFEAN